MQLDPNQYIYRRRIQQYGPRLGKPYPFYDWVQQAQAEIRERGEEPVELSVSLTGAEIARPLRKLEPETSTAANPDPAAEIIEDAELVHLQVVTVPRVVRPEAAVRVYVLLEPGENAKWNNESEPTRVWINNAAGTELSSQLIEGALPEEVESTELRQFELEVLPQASVDSVKLQGYALYYVCITESGQCVYRRQPFEIEIAVEPEASR